MLTSYLCDIINIVLKSIQLNVNKLNFKKLLLKLMSRQNGFLKQ
jgi:hypothetical protein